MKKEQEKTFTPIKQAIENLHKKYSYVPYKQIEKMVYGIQFSVASIIVFITSLPIYLFNPVAALIISTLAFIAFGFFGKKVIKVIKLHFKKGEHSANN